MNDSFSTWVMTGVAGIIGALSLAITALWNHSENRNAKAIASLEAQCLRYETRIEALQKELRDSN